MARAWPGPGSTPPITALTTAICRTETHGVAWTVGAEAPQVAFEVMGAVAVGAVEGVVRLAEYPRAGVTSMPEMRVWIRDGDVNPALPEMATVQFLGKIRLHQHPPLRIPETGVTQRARFVVADLADGQAERCGQELDRRREIAVGQRRIDVHAAHASFTTV